MRKWIIKFLLFSLYVSSVIWNNCQTFRFFYLWRNIFPLKFFFAFLRLLILLKCRSTGMLYRSFLTFHTGRGCFWTCKIEDSLGHEDKSVHALWVSSPTFLCSWVTLMHFLLADLLKQDRSPVFTPAHCSYQPRVWRLIFAILCTRPFKECG